jgi:hypothetical protein
MATPQRPDHRASPPARPTAARDSRAFARCGLSSIGSCASAIHRQANNGHNATTPGMINNLKVVGAPATRGSSRVTRRGRNIKANTTPTTAYVSTTATTNWAITRGTGPFLWSQARDNRDQRSTLNAPIAAATSSSRGADASCRLGCSSLATRPVHPVWCDAPTPRPVSPWKYS